MVLKSFGKQPEGIEASCHAQNSCRNVSMLFLLLFGQFCCLQKDYFLLYSQTFNIQYYESFSVDILIKMKKCLVEVMFREESHLVCHNSFSKSKQVAHVWLNFSKSSVTVSQKETNKDVKFSTKTMQNSLTNFHIALNHCMVFNINCQ